MEWMVRSALPAHRIIQRGKEVKPTIAKAKGEIAND